MVFNVSELSNLVSGLRETAPLVGAELSMSAGKKLTASRSEEQVLTVTGDNEGFHIVYNSQAAFFKGFAVCAAHFDDEGFCFRSEVRFSDLCCMVDCSRNAVLSVEGAKKFMRYLALMGFNSLMLYTEDTIEVEGYPYFGYMRGRLTETEIKEIEAYGEILGIGLVPCVQTLAHLNQAFKWSSFGGVIDIRDILLVGAERTYELIDAIIASCRRKYKSNVIHIGMDEAHMLGLGNYLTQNGMRNRFDIMNEHLARVSEICKKYNFKPMMWSDMFFRLAYGSYSASKGQSLAPEVLEKIPNGISMVYWNYYSHDENVYNNMFEKHTQLHNEIIFAGGAWSWKGFTPDNTFSIKATRAALSGAADRGVQKVIATMWGDDGGECSCLSLLPALSVYSQVNYDAEYSEAELSRLFKTVTGIELDSFMSIDSPARFDCVKESSSGVNPAKYLMFQDCLAGLFDKHLVEEVTAAHFEDCRRSLSETAALPDIRDEFKLLFSAHAAMADVLTIKSDLGIKIRKAYRRRDKEALSVICRETIPAVIRKIETFYALFQKVWLMTNKPYGLDIQDIRYGGLIMRLKTAASLIMDFADGRAQSVPELDEDILHYGGPDSFDPHNPYISRTRWVDIASPNVFSHELS